jgi:methionyl-tRNA synthetase
LGAGNALERKRILITSAWPYANYLPHLGTILHFLSADVVARYYRLKGEDVVMVSGSDDHGTPTEVTALKLGISPRQLTDRNYASVVESLGKWGFSFNNYTRTENPVHEKFVQEHLMKIYNNGYIFTQETEMLYCENCKRFLPDRYVEGECPYCGYKQARGDQCEDCGKLLETTLLIDPSCAICKGRPVTRKTTHWYFDLPKLSSEIADYLNRNKQLPSNARNFSVNWVKEGLKPRAVTRDVDWGITAPFPGAENKKIYVWVEAVLGYVSATIEYFKNRNESEKWKEFWFDKEAKTLYFIGKDNIPFHTIILPALLLASGEEYNLPWNVSSTEFVQFKGEKVSKSQRHGIFIDEALELFPADYWRYFLMASRPEAKDVDFSWELFIERINADLNDTFGNFIHRTLTFISKQFEGEIPQPTSLDEDAKKILEAVKERAGAIAEDIESCRLQSATATVISMSRIGNQYLNEKEPWKLIKKDKEKAAGVFYAVAQIVKTAAVVSAPFVPFAAEQLWRMLNMAGSVHEQTWDEATKPLPGGHKIAKPVPLFHKIEDKPDQLDEKLERIRENLKQTS